jgi:hypothetical protein
MDIWYNIGSFGIFFPVLVCLGQEKSGNPGRIAFFPADRICLVFKCSAPLSPGTDVIILKIFSQKHLAKKLGVLTQNKAKLCKNVIKTLVFEKNANIYAENCRKSQKIVIITSTPG